MQELERLMPESPNIKAVGLDMDGTMFNSEHIYDSVCEGVLNKRGHSFTNDLKMKMMGLATPVALQVMVQHFDLSDSISQLTDECHEIFLELMPSQIQKMPGLDTLLQHIESAGLPKAVATSSTTKIAKAALGTFDLEKRFEFILTGDDVTNGKPHPEVYSTAAKRLEIPPEEMLAIEDSVVGSKAAAASGAYTIAIPEAHSAGGDFSHAHQILDRLDSPIILRLIGAKI